MLSTLRLKGFCNNKLNFLLGSQFSVEQTVNTHFANFRKNYNEYVKEFSQKLTDAEINSIPKDPIKPKSYSYKHPYNMDHHKLTFSPVKTAEFFHDFIGPEQVSPHYENFLVSRKYLMAFWAAFFVLNFGVATADLNWIAKSSLIPLIFYTSYLYFYIEGRKAFMKPLLVRFYRRASANECFLFETYYHENIERKIRENLRITKNQMEYFNIHKSYPEIKMESVNNFLANQYYGLQQHLAQRAVNVLKAAQTFESQNHTKYLNKLVQNALDELESALKGERQAEIKELILNSAIEGLAKGYMDYQSDPLLPLILKRIEKDVAEISNLTEAEQIKLVQLTTEQLEQIRRNDQGAKNEFLTKVSESLDASLRSNDKIKRILENWGK